MMKLKLKLLTRFEIKQVLNKQIRVDEEESIKPGLQNIYD